MKKNNSCASRLCDTDRCNFVRLNKNFHFCPTCPNHPMKTKNNFSKVSHPVSNATMRSPSHLSPLPSHLTKLSHVSQLSQLSHPSQLIPAIPLIPVIPLIPAIPLIPYIHAPPHCALCIMHYAFFKALHCKPLTIRNHAFFAQTVPPSVKH